MFGWFRRKQAPAALLPEGRWTVALDDDTIRVTTDSGETKSLGKNELSGVIIEANDSGPWGADLWWLLFGSDDRVACEIPQGATGEDAFVDYLTALPGFNHEEMIKAMASVDNAAFPVWRRGA